MTGNCMTVTGETCGYWLGVKKTKKEWTRTSFHSSSLSLTKTKIKK